MNQRRLGKTNYNISEISFGAWAIGGTWGTVDDEESMRALHAALDAGINFFDSADVYGDGHSERLLARLRRERDDPFIIATKAGRRLDPHVAEGYTKENIEGFIDRSLKNLETDALDLVQLHCPPTESYYQPELFAAMDELVKAGKIRHYGVSVEKVEEALKAIEYPNVATVQLIFNAFRQRPAELFFEQALIRDVGIITRVPLASGLLTGKMTSNTNFEADDHRQFNRHGAAFDVGETFSGVDYQSGLDAVEALRSLVPENKTMAQLALSWILTHKAVSCAIPGAKNPQQVNDNAAASAMSPLSDETMAKMNKVYDDFIRASVHHRW